MEAELDLSILPPVRTFKGHPEVPYALTPDDLAILRPNCENKDLKLAPYSERVKADRELRQAEKDLADIVANYVRPIPKDDAFFVMQKLSKKRQAAYEYALKVGSP